MVGRKSGITRTGGETRGVEIPQNAFSEGTFFFFPQGASVKKRHDAYVYLCLKHNLA